jgi:hypothetical protein
MNITSIEIWQDALNSYLPLDFHDHRGVNFVFIKDATGLDADEIAAQFYGAGSKNYRNLKMPKRTVVLKIGMRAYTTGSTYGEIRDFIYKFIATTRTGQIQLRFMNESEEIARLYGYISKVESAQFDQKQEAQLTIDCIDPILRSPIITNVPILGMDPSAFLISDEKSTAPHGVTLQIHVLSSTPSITIRDPYFDTTWSFTARHILGFTAGDIVTFNSESNNRQAWILRGVNTIQLADAIIPGSTWPIIFPGTNLLSIDEATKVELQNINYSAAYWGV